MDIYFLLFCILKTNFLVCEAGGFTFVQNLVYYLVIMYRKFLGGV